MINKFFSRFNLENSLSFFKVIVFLTAILGFIIILLYEVKQSTEKFKHIIIDEINMLEANITTELQKQIIELHKIKGIIEKRRIKYPNNKKIIIKEITPKISDTIGEILLLDKDLNIISALYEEERSYKNTKLTHREYLKRLKQNPENIQIDDPVIGVLTKTWAIPLAGAILNLHNKFDGALIFSIKINYLSKILSNKKYTPVLKKIFFHRNESQRVKYIPKNSFLEESYKFFVRNVIFSKKNKFKIIAHSNAFSQNIYIVYDIADIRGKLYRSLLIDFFVIVSIAIIISLITNLLQNKIILPIKRTLERVENVISTQEKSTNHAVNDDNLKNDKINRLIRTFDSLLANFQQTNKIIENLNNNIIVSHVFFNSIIKNIKENNKFASEVLQDKIEVINLPYLLSDLSQAIKENDKVVEELHDLSVSCSKDIKYGKEEINPITWIKENITQYDLKIDGDTDDCNLMLYKNSFAEIIHNIFLLTRYSQDAELYIQVKRNEQYCQIDLSPIIISTEITTSNYFKLQKLQLRALINNIIITFDKSSAQVSIIIMK
jgi:methyl-accepting chemotaxis protein